MTKEDQKSKKSKSESKIDLQTNSDTANSQLIRKILNDIEDDVQKIKHLLFTEEHKSQVRILEQHSDENGTVVEGIFDGENMISHDGKKYTVSPNYASKSKLVAGDILKLTITPEGTFVFKQIGPVDRRKLIGDLKESHGHYYVLAENEKYRVLLASITYFKLKSGDKVTIIIPKEGKTDWAAIENIIEKK
jgi:hypothetical protein